MFPSLQVTKILVNDHDTAARRNAPRWAGTTTFSAREGRIDTKIVSVIARTFSL
jgi:hypothetical protein